MPVQALLRRPALAVAVVALLAVLTAWGATTWGIREVGRLMAGTNGLRWSRGDGGWEPVTREQASRRLWGPVDAFLQPDWSSVAAGLDVGTLAFGRGADPLDIDVVIARVSPARWRFRVWGRKDWTPGGVDELAREAGLTLAVNASYFSDSGPLGLVISDGVRRNAQGSRRAAHFLVFPGGPRIVNEKRATVAGAEQGFQGFPAIMQGGRTFSYMRDGGRGFDVWAPDRRTAACVDRGGDVLILVTDARIGGLSLDELATVMGGLGCLDAMAFDGGSSTGMSLRWGRTTVVVGNPVRVPVVMGVVAG
jgi:hypothetical protein